MKIKFSAIFLMLFLLTACSEGVIDIRSGSYYESDAKIDIVETGVIAQNDDYQLIWDSNQCCLLLITRQKSVWSSIPYSYYNDLYDASENSFDFASVQLKSALMVTYIDKETQAVYEVKSGLAVIEDGRFSSRLIDGGIRVEYYFDRQEFMIPVEFLLHEDGLEAKIPVRDIQENQNLIYQISILPYLASAKNNTGAKLFVPSGSGALMETDDTRPSRKYSEPIYGEDPAQSVHYKDNTSESIRLPVFGVLREKDGLMGIIKEGSEQGLIEAISGDSNTSYSAVWASFQIRGLDILKYTDMNNVEQLVNRYTNRRLEKEFLSVLYLPLEQEEVSVVSMASRYRTYLEKEEGFDSKNKGFPALYLNVLGGAKTDQHFLGIPHQDVTITTTYLQVEQIVSETVNLVKQPMLINMIGFGRGGTTIDRLAGGFDLNKKYGSKDQQDSLKKTCAENRVLLFADFDLINFRKSGGNFSVWRDTAKASSQGNVSLYKYDLVLQNRIENKVSYLLGRHRLIDASNKLLDAFDTKNLTGVSLSTLTNMCYSDYRNWEYAVGGGMADDVRRILDSWKVRDISILGNAANEYAAVACDYIADTPLYSSHTEGLDEDIPFYQMVFVGRTSVSSKAINLAADSHDLYLRAIASGCTLSFTVYADYDLILRESDNKAFLAGKYKDVKNMMEKYWENSKEYYQGISGETIVSYEQTKSYVCTAFSNGSRVYVNNSDQIIETPLGKVQPLDFIYGWEE